MDRFNFGGCAPAALDRAVHVPLPAETRMLARKEKPAERAGEPLPQRRIEGGIEVRVAAARPGVRFPDDLSPSDKLCVGRSEPVERAGQTGYSFLGDDFLCRVARGPAAEQCEDAGTSTLFFITVPDRSERKVAAEGARSTDRPPEALR